MPALANHKHERFAQALARGMSQTDAYEHAGYRGDRRHASRLATNGDIQARLAELQDFSAKTVEISVASITESLLRIAGKGEALADAAGMAVARASYMDAAKLNGLIVDKSQVTAENVTRLISDKPKTEEAWADAHGADLGAAEGSAALPH